MADEPARRSFIKYLGVVGAAGLANGVPAVAATSEPLAAAEPATLPPVSHAYSFFSAPEAVFVEAVVDRLIPADDLTPSGTECGIAQFIDGQLGGAWGSGDRMYMQGPWPKGTPSQGYQLPLTPAEFFRAGVVVTNAYCATTFKKPFDRLTEDQQVQLLQGMERDAIELKTPGARAFFDFMLDLTMQGLFSDSIYGGNRNKVGWKMLGFPGVIAVYSEHIKTYRNRKFDGEPTSIADLS